MDIHGLEVSVVVEDRESLVCAVANINVTLMVYLYRVHVFELSRAAASRPKVLQELAVLIEFHNSFIVVSIGDENISRCIPGHIGFTVEHGERPGIESLSTSALLRRCAGRSCHRWTR